MDTHQQKERGYQPLPAAHIPDKAQSKNAWIVAILGILYTISPIDIVPDIPIVGWIDDFFVLSATLLNLLEKTTGRTHHSLRHGLKILKWGAVIVGVIAILLILIIGALIVKYLSQYF